MIYGIGVDLVEIDRMERALSRSERFIQRYYTEKEQQLYHSRSGKRKTSFAAMNFAGKEAVSKAMGTGISKEMRLEQIEILRDQRGAPYVQLLEETKEYVKCCGVSKFHISMTDTSETACAFVVAEMD